MSLLLLFRGGAGPLVPGTGGSGVTRTHTTEVRSTLQELVALVCIEQTRVESELAETLAMSAVSEAAIRSDGIPVRVGSGVAATRVWSTLQEE